MLDWRHVECDYVRGHGVNWADGLRQRLRRLQCNPGETMHDKDKRAVVWLITWHVQKSKLPVFNSLSRVTRPTGLGSSRTWSDIERDTSFDAPRSTGEKHGSFQLSRRLRSPKDKAQEPPPVATIEVVTRDRDGTGRRAQIRESETGEITLVID